MKVTKRINQSYKVRHFEVRIISYSFYTELCGAHGRISFSVKDINNGYEGKVKVSCGERYGWNMYCNCANLNVISSIINEWLEDVL